MMFDIERNISDIPRDRYNVPPQSMSDARFVQHVAVLVAEIHDDHVRPVYQVKDVLDDRAFFPDIVGALALKARISAGVADCLVDAIELRSHRHHYGRGVARHRAHRPVEDPWRNPDLA